MSPKSRSTLSNFRSRRRVGLLAHQVVEYAVAAALIVSGTHVSGGPSRELFALGAGLGLLALVTNSTLGLAKVLSRRAHHFGDGIVISFAVVAPFFGFVRHDLTAIIAIEAIALLLIVIEQQTNYSASSRGWFASSSPKAESAVVTETPSSPTRGGRTGEIARQAGVFAGLARRGARAAGQGWRSVKD